MHLDAEFWVALGFIVFVVFLAYLGVHKRLPEALDDRARRVASELAQAKKLHDEAAAVLDTFRRKAAAAEAEAAAIVAQARREAEMMAKETEDRMAEFISRRTKQAESKIAMAKRLHDEASAVLDTFRRKAASAEAEAAAIVAQARKEAELMGQEAHARMEDFVARRTKQAEAKIAMAETQAATDVRAAAADAAVKAAEILLRRDPRGTAGLVRAGDASPRRDRRPRTERLPPKTGARERKGDIGATGTM